MTFRTFGAMVIVTLCATGASAQAPVPGAIVQPPPSSSVGVVTGRVVASDSAKPLTRVRIRLIPVVASAGATAIITSTDAVGRFTVKDVPSGPYRVEASRAGFVTVQWGQRRVREAGKTLNVTAAGTGDRIDIALPKAGVISGQVLDELGLPYPNVRVEARDMRYLAGSTTRIPVPGSATTTDDRGQFRLIELAPGAYQVTATSIERWIGRDKRPIGYPSAAYPGVPIEQAQIVTLGVSEQRANVDIQLFTGRPVRVTGVFVDPTGQRLAGENVQAGHAMRGSGAVSNVDLVTARTAADGSFELRDVMPGDYRVAATHRGANGQSESAVTFISVADADVANVVLTTRTASTVTGAVVTDAGTVPSFAGRLRVQLVPGDPDTVMATVRVQPVTADGSFRLQSVGGPFLFRLAGLPADWMISSVTLNDEDISERAWDVPTTGKEYGPLKIEVTQSLGSASGSVVDGRGSPTADAAIVIFTADDALWVPSSRLVRVARPDASGAFSVTGLPAGSYLAVARDFVEDGAENDRAFLESLRTGAAHFDLLSGGSAALTLRVTDKP